MWVASGPICRDFSIILKINLATVFSSEFLKYDLKQELCIPALVAYMVTVLD